jgi:hypothetical protein
MTLGNLEIQKEQAIAEAYGATQAEKAETLKKQTLLEEMQIKIVLDANHGQAAALEALWARYYAQLHALDTQRTLQLAQSAAETASLTQQALTAGKGPAAYTNVQIQELMRLNRVRTELDIEAERIRTLATVKDETEKKAAVDHLAAYERNAWAQNAAYQRDLINQNEDETMTIQAHAHDVLNQAFQKEWQLTEEDLAARRQVAQVVMEITQLARQDLVVAEMKDAIIAKMTAQIQKQLALQKEQAAVEAAKTVRASGASNQSAVNQSINAMHDAFETARGDLQKLLDPARQVPATLQEIAAAEQRVADSTTTLGEALEVSSKNAKQMFENMKALPDLLKDIANGLPVDKMTLLAAGFKEMGNAALQAFEAIGSGQSATQALKSFAGGMMKSLAQMAMEQAAFYAAVAVADAANPILAAVQGRTVGQDLISMAAWLAAAAALGIAGGALSGGGGGGGGGAGSKGAAVGTPAPVSTRTAMEDSIIKLNGNLVVNNRVLQYAGQQYTNLGAQMFQLTHSINMLAGSNDQTARQMSDALANTLAKVTQQGFQPNQVANLIGSFNNYVDVTNRKQATDSGVLQGIHSNLLENSAAQQALLADSRTLPSRISDNLAGNLRSMSRAQSDKNDTMIDLARRQLVELQKANDKEPTIAVDASTYLDGGALNSLASNGFTKNVKTYSRAVTAATASGLGQNSSRQQMGRAIGNGGI